MPISQKSFILKEVLPQGLTREEALRWFEVIHDWRAALLEHKFESPRIILVSLGSLSDKIAFIVAPLVASGGVSAPQICDFSSRWRRSLLDYIEAISEKKTQRQLEEIRGLLRNKKIIFFHAPPPVLSSLSNVVDLFDKGELSCRGDEFDVLVRNIVTHVWASGASGVLFDIRVGKISYVRNHEEALILTRLLRSRCRRLKIRTSCMLCRPNPFLGQAVGNSVELKEALDVLGGKGPLDVLKIAIEFGSEMLILGRKASNRIDAKRLLKRNLRNGLALDKFTDILPISAGNSQFFERINFPKEGKNSVKIYSGKSGFLQDFDKDILLSLLSDLGLQQKTHKALIHPDIGLIFYKKRGDRIERDDLLAEVYGPVKDALYLSQKINNLILLQPKPPAFQPLIIERIRDTDSL